MLVAITVLQLIVNVLLIFTTKTRSIILTIMALLTAIAYFCVMVFFQPHEDEALKAPFAINTIYATWFCYILMKNCKPAPQPISGWYVGDLIVLISMTAYLSELFSMLN